MYIKLLGVLVKKIFYAIFGILVILATFVVAQSVFVESDNTDPNFYRSLGNFLLKNGYEEQALKAYKRGLSYKPDDILLLNNIGYYYKDKNPLLAEDYFLQALEIDPEYENARNNLALLYNSLFLYDKAAAELYILVEDYPDNIKYNYDLAINLANKFYHITGEYHDLNEALKYFKIVYEMDRNFEHTMENIKVLNEIENMIINN